MIAPDALSETELMALRDVFRQAGISERAIQDIMLLLSFKPPQIQLAFYYVTTGKTQQQAATEIGVSQQQVGSYIHHNCDDIKRYLIQAISCN